MNVNDTLNERGASYGAFIDNASVAQDLKEIIVNTPNWNHLQADQREALQMFCSKISRMMTGNPNHIDNWTDIAGYATLVKERLESDDDASK